MTTNPTRDTLMERMKLCYELMQKLYENETGEKLTKHRPKQDFDEWLKGIRQEIEDCNVMIQ